MMSIRRDVTYAENRYCRLHIKYNGSYIFLVKISPYIYIYIYIYIKFIKFIIYKKKTPEFVQNDELAFY